MTDYSVTVFAVQRVHWLRARANRNRWEEELILVGYEMGWSVRYFLHHAAVWEEHGKGAALSPGAVAYAARQVARWNQMAASADHVFQVVNARYTSLVM